MRGGYYAAHGSVAKRRAPFCAHSARVGGAAASSEQDRGAVLDAERVVGGLGAGGVGGTVHVAASHAGAGEGDAENLGPVVAAAGGVEFGGGAKLGVDGR